jgi:hypothetical protein
MAMGEWQCVRILRDRVFAASNRTFLSLLVAESRTGFDPKTEYPVYASPINGDGISYFFSPPAALRFRTFIKWWGGIPFQAPKHLRFTNRVL